MPEPGPQPEPQVDDETFLDQILDQALTARADGRTLVLAELAVGRDHLRPRLAALLGIAAELAPVAAPVLAEQALRRLAGYSVLAEAGRGSMGIVYRARQENLGRVVALKILAPALTLSTHARERFAMEAQALSRVRHPHVVAVYDVLASDELCAYTMEWIDGRSLASAAAAEPGLDVATVARLGTALGRALGAVHAEGLVHRDVKPSNVLLRSDGTPVLTDFSLVRDARHSMHTATGEFVGTAAYAAPEQLRGEHERVGPWTDVYSLGATLGTALTGTAPQANTSTADVLRRIERCERPSLRRLNPKVPRDLDTILAKAMDPEPSRRYPTAVEFAEDLERMLRSEPIRARRAGPALRLVRFVERSPQLALSLFGLFVTLALALGVSIWFSLHLRVAERQARDESEIQRELAGYLRWVFRLGDPTGFGTKDMTVVGALEETAKAMGGFDHLRPESRYQIHMMVAETFVGLGRLQDALPHVDRAVALASARYGRDSEELASAMLFQGRMQRDSGDLPAAETSLREAVRIRRALQSVDRDLAAALNSLGIVLRRQSRFEDAEATYREAAERYRADLGPDNENFANMLHNLAALLTEQRKFAEAEPLQLQALEILQRKFPDQANADVANARFGLGFVQHQTGKVEPGLDLMRQGVEMLRAATGATHPRFLQQTAKLAAALAPTHPDEAIERYREAIAGHAERQPALARGEAIALADLLLAQQRPGDAEPVLVQALLGAQPAAAREVLLRLGIARTRLAHFAAAEPVLTEAWTLLGEGATADHAAVATALAELYAAWHAAAPDPAHDSRANEWRNRAGR